MFFFFSEQNEPIGPLSPTPTVDLSTHYQPSSQTSHSARSPVVGCWPPRRSKSQGEDTALIRAGQTAPHLRHLPPRSPTAASLPALTVQTRPVCAQLQGTGPLTIHCRPRRDRSAYAVVWAEDEQGDGPGSFHAFFSFSFFLLKIYILLLKSSKVNTSFSTGKLPGLRCSTNNQPHGC